MGRVETESMRIGSYDVGFAVDAGPRITSFARPGAESPFAELGDEAIEHEAIGRFHFIGGHRLWRAPEIPAVTYEPDDRPIGVFRSGDSLTLTGTADAGGVVKEITMQPAGDVLVVRHRLRNSGDRAVACAAWAITQLSPGGTAIMPQPPIDPQTDEVLADRSLVIWPYTDPTASEIHIGRDAVTISGSDSPAKAKLGQTNRRGWVAYVLGGTAFIKWSIRHRDDLEYVDLGASVQVYRDDRFVELESLSPLRTLQPGGSLDHVELWQLLEVSGIDDDRLLDLGPDPTGEWL